MAVYDFKILITCSQTPVMVSKLVSFGEFWHMHDVFIIIINVFKINSPNGFGEFVLYKMYLFNLY